MENHHWSSDRRSARTLRLFASAKHRLNLETFASDRVIIEVVDWDRCCSWCISLSLLDFLLRDLLLRNLLLRNLLLRNLLLRSLLLLGLLRALLQLCFLLDLSSLADDPLRVRRDRWPWYVMSMILMMLVMLVMWRSAKSRVIENAKAFSRFSELQRCRWGWEVGYVWVELVCFSRQVSRMGIVWTPYLCVMNHVINELPIALLCGKFLIAYLR